jgi:hypothetical protein
MNPNKTPAVLGIKLISLIYPKNNINQFKSNTGIKKNKSYNYNFLHSLGRQIGLVHSQQSIIHSSGCWHKSNIIKDFVADFSALLQK